MITRISHRPFVYGTVLLALTLTTLALAPSARAAEAMTLATETEDLQVLKAKVAHLTAHLAALKAGEPTPDTFVVALDGNVLRVDGTIVRVTDSKMMEICGPMVKGTIDWGDGVTEALHGLGCSGDVHTFTAYHAYTEGESVKVRVAGGGGRDATHVVVPAKVASDTSAMLELTSDDRTVSLTGTLSNTGTLPTPCTELAAGIIFWGDGNSEQIMTDCAASAAYEATHEYATAGTYKVLVMDRDGDAAQELVEIK